MDLDQLHIFTDVYRAGGFSPVANARNVAPSSISRAIASLEEQLGVRLFQRTTRSLKPTEAGEVYFARIFPLLEELDAARDEAQARDAQPTGRLRATASVSFGQTVLAPLLKPFRAAYPGVQLDLVLSDDQLDLIGARIDIAFRHGRLPDSSLVSRKLMDVHYQLVASPEYLAAAPAITHPQDLAEHDILTFALDGFRVSWRFRRGRDVAEVAFTPVATISNALALAAAARSGLGLALLADWTVAEDIRAGRLIQLLPHWEGAGAHFESAVWTVFPSRKFLPEKSRVFADFLHDALSRRSGPVHRI